MVSFTDKSSGDVNGWTWDFGPGEGTSSERNPTHQFSDYGPRSVTLTVVGPGGLDSITKTVTISPPPTDPPTPPPTDPPPPPTLPPAVEPTPA